MNLNRPFSKETIQMNSRHLKKMFNSLIIREMQIKTRMRYHLTSTRMTIINKSTYNKCWLVSIWTKKDSCALLVGMQIGAATVENMEFPQKTRKAVLFLTYFREDSFKLKCTIPVLYKENTTAEELLSIYYRKKHTFTMLYIYVYIYIYGKSMHMVY